MAVAIALENVTAGYAGKRLFQNLSLTIKAGERVAIMGRSGAGKSTLINLIYRSWPQSIALVPQGNALVANLSVFHNVFMGRLDHHSSFYNLRTLLWPPARDVEEVSRLLTTVGLAKEIFAKAGELSGGQQQRTAVARAIYSERPVVIADEPVSGLDRVQSGDILRLLTERHQTRIFALHDIRLALEHTDRIVMVELGSIVLDEPTALLSHDRLLPYFEGELA